MKPDCSERVVCCCFMTLQMAGGRLDNSRAASLLGRRDRIAELLVLDQRQNSKETEGGDHLKSIDRI